MSAVEHFILNQKKIYRTTLIQLHELIINHSEVTAKIKWHIPVYDAKTYFCYLNPIKNSNHVELCFAQGFNISDPNSMLSARGRKIVKGIYVSDINNELIGSLNELISNAINYNLNRP